MVRLGVGDTDARANQRMHQAVDIDRQDRADDIRRQAFHAQTQEIRNRLQWLSAGDRFQNLFLEILQPIIGSGWKHSRSPQIGRQVSPVYYGGVRAVCGVRLFRALCAMPRSL